MGFYGGHDPFGHLNGPELDEDGKARAGAALADGVAVASESAVIDAMREVYDPEIPVNIFELGLIYDYKIDSAGAVEIQMTLTAPGCPVAGILPGHLARTVSEAEGVGEVVVELVWDPPWSMEMMSEAARVELDMF
ncbi:MAG: SUF system Fe-S cluster assembly protein [Rhodospirillaceae bacterium]|nr:SUF system Fe-S cluster assembly protein [Rhodospirillaceae bacterium]MBT5192260.1 SUF system Fe-S cluster assembly protein [Rhodospirillaceae bacterium]MBT5898077.1 SUF system Fe-S cluster assembly protein [Rhodospirillaceae bacterium]MBT6426886.1 SUF system Fe-S cluster assembly protein [Rhodospirillaceae bacterium]MBT7757880.1 SUF system Fe-S cluster assembly protein [Rhodospirillaceae bacterium]